jgi:hypothetical protein
VVKVSMEIYAQIMYVSMLNKEEFLNKMSKVHKY